VIRTIEAVIDEQGGVHLLEPVRLASTWRALVTILEESPLAGVSESALLRNARKTGRVRTAAAESSFAVWRCGTAPFALLSEAALAQDRGRPEEDEAWSHLREAP
jgi:hypothetical protein